MSKNKDTFIRDSTYFAELDIIDESDLKDSFEAFKKEAFKSWKYPETKEEQRNILKDIRDKPKYCTHYRSKCDVCNALRKEADELNKMWKEG